MGAAYADDGSGDGMRGANGDPSEGGAEERDGASGFGAKSADGLELGDLRAHGVDDAPAAEVGAECNGRVGGEDDGPVPVSPVGGEIGLRHDAGSVEGSGDDAHGLLRVVPAVSEAVSGGGEKLEAAEELVDLARRFPMKNPGDGHHHAEGDDETHRGATTMKMSVLVQPLLMMTWGADDHPCSMAERAMAAPA